MGRLFPTGPGMQPSFQETLRMSPAPLVTGLLVTGSPSSRPCYYHLFILERNLGSEERSYVPEVRRISLDFSFRGEFYLFGLGAARTPRGGPCALPCQALQATLLGLP